MAFCTNCGTQVADGIKFCTSCGSSMKMNTAVPAPSTEPRPECATEQPAPVAPANTPSQPISLTLQPQQPKGAQQPTSSTGYSTPTSIYQEDPISTSSYVGILFLLMIPLLNLLLLLIWACGGCRKVNKRNLSRALLIWMLIGCVLSGILFLVGGFFFTDQLDMLKELGNEYCK